MCVRFRGKTQVYSVLKNKAKVIESYESSHEKNASVSTRRQRKSPYGELNELLYEWYRLALHKNVVPDGPTLIEKAKTIAQRLHIDGFKASNGWLQKWKVSHNLKCRTVSGESGEVSVSTTQSWKERLPEIMEGYDEIFFSIWMKLAAFGRHCLKRALQRKVKCANEGKRANCD